MLSKEEFSDWYKCLNISEHSIKYIQGIRDSEPSRNVNNRRGNVKGRFPSRKQGFTIQFESHTVELPAIYQMEYNDDVLEYYDQPRSIKIRYKAGKNDKVVGVNYTPDFLVIRKDCVGFEEWKTEEELIRLSAEMPNRYIRTGDGDWRCPPGEEFAAQFGLYFRLRSSAEINRTLYRNLRYLDDYLRDGIITVPEQVAKSILDTVNNHPGISVQNLLGLPGVNANHVNILIVLHQVYVDLFTDILAEQDLAFVYKDEQIAKAYQIRRQRQVAPSIPLIIKVEVGKRINWDGKEWIIANSGVSEITITPIGDGATISLPRRDFEYLCNEGKIQGLVGDLVSEIDTKISEKLRWAGEEALKIANYRYKVITGRILDEEKSEILETPRTIRNWKREYKKAQRLYGFGLVGLLPNRHRQGNSNNHGLSEANLKFMNKYIEEYYETKNWPIKLRAYEAYSKNCAEEGLLAVCEKTFYKFLNNRPKFEQTEKTQGHRAAYKYEQWYVEWESPRHGDRVFELAHMDHTQLDIQLNDSQDGENLGKPWLSIMIDAYSRKILAAYLTFDPPSYRSCMMLIRECVKRHGRLPMEVVVDNGKEFYSVYFETLLAMYEVTPKRRPPAKPRFSSVCERVFGTTNTQFIHNLMGNTKIMRNFRQVTKSVDPKELAIWTLPELYPVLLEYVYEIYDQRVHSTLSKSPRDAFQQSLLRAGDRTSCQNTMIAYDQTFRILTMPAAKYKEVIVHAGSGVKVNRFTYWSEAFNDPRIQGEKVAVRYDPLDISQAWAYVHKYWVSCQAGHYLALLGRSEREIEIVTSEYKRLKCKKHDQVTEKGLIDFLQESHENEAIMLQRRRDKELKAAFTVIEGGKGNGNLAKDGKLVKAKGNEAKINKVLSHGGNGVVQTLTNSKSSRSFDWSNVE